ncbi:MAG: T9SS type A sorting domain-containing protein [candidate division WOR-3 bacterium]|nr:T9SS type A sorting domain-containing protein [candidate division WOR-3 bacterium]MDH5683063.1 T9SS type A sorting domain-containing protein [candidate division WOR-3 bacterium]
MKKFKLVHLASLNGPFAFPSKTRNLIFLATLHLALCTIVSAQWLETTIPVGSNPYALCWNSTNNKVYCANWNSANVTIIDGATNSVITTVPVRIGPRVLCWNSASNKVYCANAWCDSVSIIDGVTNSVIITLPVGTYPCALCWNSNNNKVYCANYNSNNVTIIDGATDSIITTVTTGSWPNALCWNSTNNKVYCANGANDNVTVIDGTNNSVITTIPVGAFPRAFCWNSIQNRVYVANYWSSSISVIRDVTGIEEECQTLDALSSTPEIYPNPAKSFLAIRLPQTADRQMIKIFDVSGKLVKVEEKITSAQSQKQEIRISLKGISPGIYFLRLGKDTQKFLVIK